MNGRERLAVVLLAAAFLTGAAVSWAKRSFTARHATGGPIAVVADTSMPSSTLGSGNRIDLNTATVSELEALPGIGPVIAARIVAHRDRAGMFRSIGQLRDVGGIGPKRFADIESLVRVGRDSAR